jgi:hypothetical protein
VLLPKTVVTENTSVAPSSMVALKAQGTFGTAASVDVLLRPVEID